MDLAHEAAMFRLKPYLTEAAGLSVFSFPGTREEFMDGLVNIGMGGCLIRFALQFEGGMIDIKLIRRA